MLSFLVVLMHSHSFLMGQKMSMMLRIISTAAIYQKASGVKIEKTADILLSSSSTSMNPSLDHSQVHKWLNIQAGIVQNAYLISLSLIFTSYVY